MLGWPDIISQTDSLVVYDPGSSSRDLVKGPIFVTFSPIMGINPGHFQETGCMFVFDDFN